MTNKDSRSTISTMTNTIKRINKLEQQVGELLELCQRLVDDNKDLRSQVQQLTTERSTLFEQKQKIRVQVESMITRLQSMEKALSFTLQTKIIDIKVKPRE